MAVMSKQTKAVGALVVTGGVLIIAGRLLRQRVKEFQREQTELYNQSLMSRRKTYSMDSRKVAVDITFGKRLMVILSLCVPHVWSKEAFFIIIQSFLLYSRTLLSDWISSIEGEIAQCLISKNWSTFVKCLATFALTAFPAATVNSGLKAMRNTWEKYGCSIMVDGWTTSRGRTLINFLVASKKGTVFIKSVDASDHVKRSDYLLKLFEETVNFVGEKNVVQFIIDNASNYVKAGEELMKRHPSIYWTPCAAHCLDLLLEDLSKIDHITEAINGAKQIGKFVYNHGIILSLVRKYTEGKDIVRPATTRFATHFLTLKSLESKRLQLMQAFASESWLHGEDFLQYRTSPDGRETSELVYNNAFWEKVSASVKNLISLSFQEVLTKHLHQAYLTNRVYYTATILGGLSNPDQRITEDVAKFCSSISELHSQTFKPVLDVILFSKALAKTIRYKGQFVLYAYFILSSMVLRSISPPLALLTAQEAALSGNFRNAHQRIVAHAEEIAFNDPPGGKTECLILNDHLHKLIRHSQLSVAQRFLQQIADGYIVKYMATVIGFCVFAAPFYFAKEAGSHLTTGEYVRSVRLLTNSSDAIGQLILVYKRVTTLAGYTSRVSELLESVNALGRKKELLPKNISSNVESKPYLEGSSDALPQTPTIIFGNLIKFEKVTIYSPDHTLLVHELSFEVTPGNSVIIMGPNGSGKSSILRVLAELWSLHSGTITKPPPEEIFYLSQRPYLLRGSLRDQVCYPELNKGRMDISCKHGSDWRDSSVLPCNHSDDNRILEVLEATEISYLVDRGYGLDKVQNWEEILSGGERQRLAVSRLLYHSPRFAVLDECTSAVSVDGEEKLYKTLHNHGITMLSVAHRPAVMRFHSACLYIDGSQTEIGWKFEKLTAGISS